MTLFTRWSQRKRGLEPVEEETSDPLSPMEETGTNPEKDTSDSAPFSPDPVEETPPQASADDLPDPDTLPPGSDLTAYLADGVNRELRRRALKRLFAADHYHQRDGLNDYDDDYRKLETLSRDVADRLRQWTRQLDDEAQAPTAEAPTDQAAQALAQDTSSPDGESGQVPAPGRNIDGLSDTDARDTRLAGQEEETRPTDGDSEYLSKR